MQKRYVVPLVLCGLVAGWFGPQLVAHFKSPSGAAPLIPAVGGLGSYRIAECDDIVSPGSNSSGLTIDFKNTTGSPEKLIPDVEIDMNPIGTGLWDRETGGQLTETSGYSYSAQPGQTIVIKVVTVRTVPSICGQNLSVDFQVPDPPSS